MSRTLIAESDVLSSAEAECYITLKGRRYNAIHALSCEASYEKVKKELPRLGSRTKGTKTVGGKGTGKMTLYYVSSVFRRAAIEYIHTGKDVFFDTQITNEDSTSSIGRQTVILKNCNFDKILLAKFAADGDFLQEDMDFTFSDVEMPEEFSDFAGL